jgi:hypothetical protein
MGACFSPTSPSMGFPRRILFQFGDEPRSRRTLGFIVKDEVCRNSDSFGGFLFRMWGLLDYLFSFSDYAGSSSACVASRDASG